MNYSHRTRRSTRIQNIKKVSLFLAISFLVLIFFSVSSLRPYTANKTVLSIAKKMQFSSDFLKYPKRTYRYLANYYLLESSIRKVGVTGFLPALHPYDREAVIADMLKRQPDKKLMLNKDNFYGFLEERADLDTVITQQVIALLPGEKIAVDKNFFLSSNFLSLRCLGATDDRLDLPGNFNVHIKNQVTKYKISPRGLPTLVRVGGVFEADNILLEWDSGSSGILVITGSEPTPSEASSALLLTIDSLEGGLASLPRTLALLKESFSGNVTVSKAVASSDNPSANLQAILLDELPSNITGFSSDTSVNRNYLSGRTQSLERLFKGKNFLTNKIEISFEENSNKTYSSHLNYDFDTTVKITKNSEILMGATSVLANLEAVGKSFFHIDFQVKASNFLLTWPSALDARGGIFTWINANFMNYFFESKKYEMVQEQEKSIQLDTLLARFLKKNKIKFNNIAIVIQKVPDNSSVVVFGETLIANKNTKPILSNGLLSQENIARLAFSEMLEFPVKNINQFSIFQTKQREFFVNGDGWISFPINGHSDQKDYFDVLSNVIIEKRSDFLAKIIEVRNRYKLQSLHILLPKKDGVKTRTVQISSDYPIIACWDQNKSQIYMAKNYEEKTVLLLPQLGGFDTSYHISCLINHISLTNTDQSPKNLRLAVSENDKFINSQDLVLGQFAISGNKFKSAVPEFIIAGDYEDMLIPAQIPPLFPENIADKVKIWRESFPRLIE